MKFFFAILCLVSQFAFAGWEDFEVFTPVEKKTAELFSATFDPAGNMFVSGHVYLDTWQWFIRKFDVSSSKWSTVDLWPASDNGSRAIDLVAAGTNNIVAVGFRTDEKNNRHWLVRSYNGANSKDVDDFYIGEGQITTARSIFLDSLGDFWVAGTVTAKGLSNVLVKIYSKDSNSVLFQSAGKYGLGASTPTLALIGGKIFLVFNEVVSENHDQIVFLQYDSNSKKFEEKWRSNSSESCFSLRIDGNSKGRLGIVGYCKLDSIRRSALFLSLDFGSTWGSMISLIPEGSTEGWSNDIKFSSSDEIYWVQNGRAEKVYWSVYRSGDLGKTWEVSDFNYGGEGKGSNILGLAFDGEENLYGLGWTNFDGHGQTRVRKYFE